MNNSMNNEENISKFPEAKLREIEAFQKLDACNLKNIADNGQILDFKEGWPLSNEDEISSKIYFIIKGCARLLGIQEKIQLIVCFLDISIKCF